MTYIRFRISTDPSAKRAACPRMRSPNGMKKRRHGIGRRTRQTFFCTKPASRTPARQRGISAAGATGSSGSQRKWKTDTPCKRLRSKAGSAQGSPAKKRATACAWCTAGATRISNGAITQATPTPSCGSRALRFACGFMRTACINNQKKKNGKTKKAPMHAALFLTLRQSAGVLGKWKIFLALHIPDAANGKTDRKCIQIAEFLNILA